MRQRFAPAMVLATVALAVALTGFVVVLLVAGVWAEQDLTPAEPVAQTKPVAKVKLLQGQVVVKAKPVAKAKPLAPEVAAERNVASVMNLTARGLALAAEITSLVKTPGTCAVTQPQVATKAMLFSAIMDDVAEYDPTTLEKARYNVGRLEDAQRELNNQLYYVNSVCS